MVSKPLIIISELSSEFLKHSKGSLLVLTLEKWEDKMQLSPIGLGENYIIWVGILIIITPSLGIIILVVYLILNFKSDPIFLYRFSSIII